MMSMDNGRQEQVSVAVPERSEGTATEAPRPDPEVPAGTSSPHAHRNHCNLPFSAQGHNVSEPFNGIQ